MSLDPSRAGSPAAGDGAGLDARPGNPQRLSKPFKVTLAYTETCNLDCRLCYADCGRARRPELGLDDWRQILDDLEQSGVVFLYIEGGEPFCRPDFLDLLRLATPRFYTMVRTNGTLITAELARELEALNVATVLVDIWGASAATHDGLTGVPGSFEASCGAVRHLLAAGVDTWLLTILNRHNAGEAHDYLRLAQDLGVGTVGFLRLYPLGRVKARWREFALSLDEMMAVVDGLGQPEGLRIMRSWHPYNANCCWQMAAINAFGQSIGCSYLREYVDYGNVLEQPFLDTWNHPLCRELRSGKVEEDCPDCTRNEGSRGGCRSTAFAFTGRFDAGDPFDTHLNRGVDLLELPDLALASRPNGSTAADP